MSEAEINNSLTDSFLAKRPNFLVCFAQLFSKVMLDSDTSNAMRVAAVLVTLQAIGVVPSLTRLAVKTKQL